MIEIFAIILSAVGIAWARKGDIAQTLREPESRPTLEQRLKSPQARYVRNLSMCLAQTRRILQSGTREVLAVYFLSTILLSFFMIFSWKQNGNIFATSDQLATTQINERNFYFITVSILFTFNFYINKKWEKIERYIKKNIDINLAITTRIISCVFISLSTYFLFGSKLITAIFFIISVICSTSDCISNQDIKTRNEESKAIKNKKKSICKASAFGPLALLLVATSTIREYILQHSTLEYAAIALILLLPSLSATLCWLGLKGKHIGCFEDLPKFSRATVSMGLHICNSFSGFAASVTIAATVPHLLPDQGVAVSVGFFLTSAIFLAGARTLAGSGLVVFAVTLVTAAFMLPTLLSGNTETASGRIYEFILIWFWLPTLTSSFSICTIFTTRKLLTKIKKNPTSIVPLFTTDACLALALFLLQYISIFSTLRAYSNIGGVRFNFNSFINEHIASPFDMNSWITFICIITLIPTTCHFGVLVSSGISQFISKKLRKRTLKHLKSSVREDSSIPQADIDSIAWKMTAFDPISSTMFFISAAYVAIKAVLGQYELARSTIGYLLIKITSGSQSPYLHATISIIAFGVSIALYFAIKNLTNRTSTVESLTQNKQFTR